ncbi:ABC transporter substrate-binding protein [Leekyejoonella antrihumi]|uniref:ABC transporter substrate-binding protein n=1 Tax=Leekyejoonella antrihumi TaxID=1660198 RepID=A0A563E247_9MICO|nr:ABC transporter substrate-binding protein [Leekyejoonella antrihumi]TWP36620.1 ABC transporter substrate-binding protein [Leekyejoonella antrihumi]
MKKSLAIVVAGAAAGLMSLAACSGGQSTGSGSGSSQSGAPRQGGTATFAWLPNSVPNYIFPMNSSTYYSVQNMEQFQKLMFRPLYMYGVNGQPVVSTNASLAYAPTFNDAKHTVTVKLRDYKWSNGESVTAKNVVFWQHLVTAEKNNWGGYVGGLYPDNITSVHIDNAHQVTFTLNANYNHTWFWYNELTYITPLPMAWDKTSDGATPGSGGCTNDVSRCAAVYKYLASQAKNLQTYASNPLWQVVNGPWKLKSFQSNGNATFVPNSKYSGPDKPHLAEFKTLAFTSTDAEVNELRSGSSISVGYLPATANVSKSASGAASNPMSSSYNLVPWYWWGIDYLQPNYNNPKVGPLFKQLYIRQALQHVVDQPSVIKGALKGFGSPTNGPVPLEPKNPYASSYERSNPYPFSVSAAETLLKSHGWSVVPDGKTTCTTAGSGPGQCGPGIAKGTALTFNLMYADYGPAYDQSMNLFRSNASKAGIAVNVQKAPFNTVIGDTVRCKPTDSNCSWQLSEYGGWALRPYPTVGQLFSTATSDGGWNDPKIDGLIAAATRGNSNAALTAYQDYLAKQVPLIWQPLPVQQLTEIVKGLNGVTPLNPMLTLTPENWYFTK